MSFIRLIKVSAILIVSASLQGCDEPEPWVIIDDPELEMMGRISGNPYVLSVDQTSIKTANGITQSRGRTTWSFEQDGLENGFLNGKTYRYATFVQENDCAAGLMRHTKFTYHYSDGSVDTNDDPSNWEQADLAYDRFVCAW